MEKETSLRRAGGALATRQRRKPEQANPNLSAIQTVATTAPDSALVPFIFDGREVRTVTINGQPWFVVADVCAALELEHTHKAVKGLRKADLTKIPVSSYGQSRNMLVTNEPGLYRLILRSYKPEAERFQDWICREVLPSIRKTGKYQLDLRGWLSSGPKPWTKTFPDRY